MMVSERVPAFFAGSALVGQIIYFAIWQADPDAWWRE
jgi:hypothetical protein